MSITIQNIELLLLVLVRVSAFIYTAPFFNMKNVPIKVKAGFSFFLAVLIYSTLGYEPLNYNTAIEFGILIAKETLAGLLLGYFSNIALTILNFAGKIIDMEIGLSMVTELDPLTNIQSSITGNFYSYMIMLMMIVTNMHHFIIRALVESFQIIPVNTVSLHEDLYIVMLQFMVDYFVIAFRIVLPIFAVALLVNAILGILAKVAPQMNMFVIGIQLKVLVGLAVLFFISSLIPAVADKIFEEMRIMMNLILEAIKK